MGSYCTFSVPGKTAALVPEFAVEDLPSAELEPRFLHLQWRTCPWTEHSDDDNKYIIYSTLFYLMIALYYCISKVIVVHRWRSLIWTINYGLMSGMNVTIFSILFLTNKSNVDRIQDIVFLNSVLVWPKNFPNHVHHIFRWQSPCKQQIQFSLQTIPLMKPNPNGWT